MKERQLADGRGGGAGGRSQIIRPQKAWSSTNYLTLSGDISVYSPPRHYLTCVTVVFDFGSVLTRNPDLWQQPGPSAAEAALLERQNYWDPSFGSWWPGNTVSKYNYF